MKQLSKHTFFGVCFALRQVLWVYDRGERRVQRAVVFSHTPFLSRPEEFSCKSTHALAVEARRAVLLCALVAAESVELLEVESTHVAQDCLVHDVLADGEVALLLSH